MAEIYKSRIIKLLRHADYKPVKVAELAKTLGVDADAYPEFKNTFDELRRAGHVIIGAGDLATLPSISGQVMGTFRANPRGFGFVVPLEPSSQGDLFIPPDAKGDAMSGDTVLAKVIRQGKRRGEGRLAGEIIQVMERASNQFVGTLTRRPEAWIVQPDGSRFFDPIVVEDVSAKNAHERDKVVVEILSYPTERHPARGVIVEVLGKAGRYDTEIEAVSRSYHLPGPFPTECVEQSRQAAADFMGKSEHQREDVTDKVIVTIDPPDAKDFDDAISLETDPEGDWVLGVHIADVCQFIPTGSPLDEEARLRGNSVYLPGRTIPMLPEILSNGICSLQPDQPRFVKSVYITYDADGQALSQRYANSLIRSKARLTYQQVDRILKGHTADAAPKVIDLLGRMEILSRRIEKRRNENGMLHLDIPEPELVFDEAGQVVDAHPADTSYPHTIIEMFMVEANEAVAGLLDRHNLTFMRRIHPEPDGLTMQNLSRLLRAMGYAVPKHPDRLTLQAILTAVQGADNSFAINMLVLRSLERAQYSPSSIGHYALASTHYCHFTSPIRRYADLLVHRQLQLYLEGRIAAAKAIAAGQDLVEMGRHITLTEERADNAERDLVATLTLQMLSKHVGDEMDGVVTGLTGFGIFVQSTKFGIEGLIRLEDLGNDQWTYNKRAQCLIGQRSGQTIQLGHTLKVRIVSVNIPGRQLNLAPSEPLGQTRPGRRGKAEGGAGERKRRTKSHREPRAKKSQLKPKSTRRKKGRR
jgi:ribonuclease R